MTFVCDGVTYTKAPVDNTGNQSCDLCLEQDCNCWYPAYDPALGAEVRVACQRASEGGGCACTSGGKTLYNEDDVQACFYND